MPASLYIRTWQLASQLPARLPAQVGTLTASKASLGPLLPLPPALAAELHATAELAGVGAVLCLEVADLAADAASAGTIPIMQASHRLSGHLVRPSSPCAASQLFREDRLKTLGGEHWRSTWSRRAGAGSSAGAGLCTSISLPPYEP